MFFEWKVLKIICKKNFLKFLQGGIKSSQTYPSLVYELTEIAIEINYHSPKSMTWPVARRWHHQVTYYKLKHLL